MVWCRTGEFLVGLSNWAPTFFFPNVGGPRRPLVTSARLRVWVGSRLRVWVHRTETASAVFSLVVVLVILTSCHTAAAFHVMLLLQ